MTASVWQSFFSWPNGGIWSNLIASAITAVLVRAWMYHHFRCYHCWRIGKVPVRGTVHRVCKKHAIEHGHTH